MVKNNILIEYILSVNRTNYFSLHVKRKILSGLRLNTSESNNLQSNITKINIIRFMLSINI